MEDPAVDVHMMRARHPGSRPGQPGHRGDGTRRIHDGARVRHLAARFEVERRSGRARDSRRLRRVSSSTGCRASFQIAITGMPATSVVS